MVENAGEIEIYQTKNGKVSLNVQLDKDDVWLTQKQIALLFNKGRVTITEHINHIFKERELDKASVCRNFRHTASDGKCYDTVYYNLDVIMSVGYRVKSREGTRFRQWSTQVLKSHIVKGYTRNPDRLDNVENLVKCLKDTLETTTRNVNRLLIHTPHRDYVHALDEKIDKLKEDFDSIVRELKGKKLVQ